MAFLWRVEEPPGRRHYWGDGSYEYHTNVEAYPAYYQLPSYLYNIVQGATEAVMRSPCLPVEARRSTPRCARARHRSQFMH